MKTRQFILLLSSGLLSMSMAYGQTVQIGNVTNGLTASGNTISINKGGNSIQIGGVPPLLQGAVSATKEALGDTGTTDTSKINPENMEKINAAKANFLKEKDEVMAKENEKIITQKNENQENKQEQKTVRVGQDLSTLKPTLVTNNIAFYNKTTINQIEEKSREDNPKMYEKFPEYIIKDY
jgi:hypothetical protein